MVQRAVRTGQLCIFFLPAYSSTNVQQGGFLLGLTRSLILDNVFENLKLGFLMQGAVQAHSEKYPVIEPISPGKAEERLTEAWKVN